VRLVDKEHCFLIKDFFSDQICSGFSKNSLNGNLPQDINTALSFFNQDIKLGYLNQVHSSKVISLERGGLYEGDGLFTEKANLVLAVRTADCLPLFFESRELGVVGVVHMGWKSAKAGILDNIAYDLKSFKVVAGVGLRRPCYEVGNDFLKQEPLKPFIEKAGSKLYFNPVEFSKNKLLTKGLKEDNFIDLDICSFCSQNNFFSCRRDNTSSRTLSFILRI